jgi:hypothetical protein
MERGNIEFKKKLEETLGDKMPKPEDIKLSAITKRIILSFDKYQELQRIFTLGAYNMWCTGVNKSVDPNADPDAAGLNFVETHDAENFGDLFITEHVAAYEEKKAAAEKEQGENK